MLNTTANCCAQEETNAGRTLTYRVHHLRSRDLLFGAFMFLTYLLYLFKAVPELCSIGPPKHNGTRISISDWPLSWQLVCGHLTDDSSGVTPGVLLMPAIFTPLLHATTECSCINRTDDSRVERSLCLLSCGWSQASLLVASKALRVSLIIAQGTVTFIGLGFLHNDLAQIIVTPLRVLAWVLLLLPLPNINLSELKATLWTPGIGRSGGSSSRNGSSSSNSNRALIIWRTPIVCYNPLLRHLLVSMFRLAPAIAASSSVGYISSRYFNQSCLSFYPTLGLYMYVGWTAYVLVLPFKLHMVVSCAEWLLSYSTSVRVDTAYQHLVDGPSRLSLHPVLHLLVSVVFVLVLPGFGVWWLEHSSKVNSTAALAAGRGAADGRPGSSCASKFCSSEAQLRDDATTAVKDAGKPAARIEAKHSGSNSSDTPRPSATSGVSEPGPCQPTRRSSAIKRGNQLMSDITGSLQLAAATPRVVPVSSSPAPLPADAAVATGSTAHCSSTATVLPDILPSLRGLLGAESAAAVFAAAAAAAADHVAVSHPLYESMATNMSVGVKVHSAPHSAVLGLTPLLTAAVKQQVTAGRSSNLLYPVYAHSACFPGCVQLLASVYSLRRYALAAEGVTDDGGGGGDDDQHQQASTAAGLLTRVCTKIRGLEEASRLQGVSASWVAISVGAVSVSTNSGTASKTSSPDSMTAACQRRDGTSTAAEPTATAVVAAEAEGPMALVRCEPICFVSGRQQHLELHLAGSALSQPCRLLVFQSGKVLVEEQLGSGWPHGEPAVVSVNIPSLAPGVMHVALVPGLQPTDQLQAAAAESAASTAQSLLLQPVLVLSENAAEELKLLGKSAVTPADLRGRSGSAARSANWSFMANLAVDVAYVLAAAEDPEVKAASRTGSEDVLPVGVRKVLTHVCVHLAIWKCYLTLNFLIDHLTAALLPAGSAAPGAAEKSLSSNAAARDSAAVIPAVPSGMMMASSSKQPISSDGGNLPSSGGAAKSCAIESDPECKPFTNRAWATGDTAGLSSSQRSALSVAAVSELRDLLSGQQGVTWRAAARQLCHGFDNPLLETQYLDDICQHTYLADLFSAVYAFSVALSADVLTDQLRAEWSAGAWGLVAWELLSRFINFVGLVVPNCLVLLHRHRLTAGGRREWAVVWCERALAVVPVLTGLGLLRINASAVEILANPHIMLTVVFWVSGAIKAAARQVRMRKLVPTLLAEFTGAVALSLPLGLTLGASVFRYAGTPLAAILTATALELRSRRAFLIKMSKDCGGHCKDE